MQGLSKNVRRAIAFSFMLVSACAQEPASEPAQGPASDPRAAFVDSLFTGAEQHHNFNRLKEIFPTHHITASPQPRPFPQGTPITLPATYRFEGVERNLDAFREQLRNVAFLVVSGGELVYEDYRRTGGAGVNWMSMSVGKSFVSALIGIAIDEGLIEGVAVPITRYVPELKGSAYDDVSIKDVLQMSSGARWNEDYSDPDSDIMRYGAVWASGGSLDSFTASLVRERAPGTYNYYNSTDTQALGMLLRRATGQTLAAYLQAKLWHPLGAEHDAWWITDDSGMEMAAGGLQVTARDYAKLGQLFLQQGRWQQQQIVSAAWVRDSLTSDGPHLKPEAHPEFPVGYGYQWWIPDGDEGEFMALGIYNQTIYVNPSRNVVLVSLSANPDYGLTNDESSYHEMEMIEACRAVARLFPLRAD